MTTREAAEQRPAKRQRVEPNAQADEAADLNGTGVEFQILQGYRDFDHEVNMDRVSVARNGNINIAVDRLKTVDKLFDRASTLASNRNSLLAQDSRAVLNITELAQLSVRNMKFDDSRKLLSIEDIVNSCKRYMLRDYFRVNSITEEYGNSGENGDELELNDPEDNEQEANEANNGMSEITDQDHFKRREIQRTHLQKFAKYDRFGQFNWIKMGALFQMMGKSPVTVDHMLGPFALEKKKRAPVQRRQAESVGQASTAEVVTNGSLNAAQEKTTPEQVKKCYKVLIEKNGTKQINLLKFVIDPNSFARSVENLFYTSFLIKGGKLVLEEDSDGYPAIRPKEGLPRDSHEREIEIQRRNDASQNHIIFQMDMTTWQQLIEQFKIRESFIP